jgi:hypothetical protein
VVFAGMAFVVAVILAQGSLEHCGGGKSKGTLLCDRFGTLGESFFTIAQTMTGGVDWGYFADAICAADPQSGVVYVVFSVFMYIVALNIIVGIFVTEVDNVAKHEVDDSYFYDKMRQRTNPGIG